MIFDVSVIVEAWQLNITISPYEIGTDLITTSFPVCTNGSLILPFTRILTCGSGIPTALHATEISLSCSSEQCPEDEFHSGSTISLVSLGMLAMIGLVDCTNMGETTIKMIKYGINTSYPMGETVKLYIWVNN